MLISLFFKDFLLFQKKLCKVKKVVAKKNLLDLVALDFGMGA
jgi:hypothetical protein